MPQILTDITLQGAGYTIDGGNSVRIFNVGTSGDFTINQATLQNGTASNGGAIFSAGLLRVMNSNFFSNTATSTLGGGAIFQVNSGKANPKKKVSTDDTDFHRYSRGNLCASVKSVDRQKS